MSDALGDALQKLSRTDYVTPALSSVPVLPPIVTATETLNSDAGTQSLTTPAPAVCEPACELQPAIPVGEVGSTRTFAETSVTAEPVTDSSSAPDTEEVPAPAPAHLTSRFAFVREHRKVLSAAVVVVCALAIWRDVNPPSAPGSTDAASEEGEDLDAFLSQFEEPSDTRPEPAEPQNPTDAPLMIPSSPGGQEAPAFEGNSSHATASYPDDNAGDLTPAPESAERPATNSRPVRFTGRIQPAR